MFKREHSPDASNEKPNKRVTRSSSRPLSNMSQTMSEDERFARMLQEKEDAAMEKSHAVPHVALKMISKQNKLSILSDVLSGHMKGVGKNDSVANQAKIKDILVRMKKTKEEPKPKAGPESVTPPAKPMLEMSDDERLARELQDEEDRLSSMQLTSKPAALSNLGALMKVLPKKQQQVILSEALQQVNSQASDETTVQQQTQAIAAAMEKVQQQPDPQPTNAMTMQEEFKNDESEYKPIMPNVRRLGPLERLNLWSDKYGGFAIYHVDHKGDKMLI